MFSQKLKNNEVGGGGGTIDGLNEELITEIHEDNIDEEIKKTTDMNVKIDSGVYAIDKYLLGVNKNTRIKDDDWRCGEFEQENLNINGRKDHVRLPKLLVKKFHGEPILWPEFKEMFYATVDSNTRLSGY